MSDSDGMTLVSISGLDDVTVRGAGHTLQEAGDVLQLWDVVLLVAAVFLQQGEHTVVFAAGVSRVQSLQLLEHLPPCDPLLLCVLHPRDDLTTGTNTRVSSISLCLPLFFRLSCRVWRFGILTNHGTRVAALGDNAAGFSNAINLSL